VRNPLNRKRGGEGEGRKKVRKEGYRGERKKERRNMH